MSSNISSILTFHNTTYLDELFHRENNNHFGVLELNIPKDKMSHFEWDIVFSIDSSGSMSDLCADNRSKLSHIKHTISNILRLIATNKEAKFNVFIQTFDDILNEIFDFTCITEENLEELIHKIEKIYPGCSTDLCLPLKSSHTKYKERRETHPNNHFIHIELTDGDDTCGNCLSSLKENLCNDYKNIFIGFGKDHNSIILNTLASNNINEYRFIDKLESAGLIYGEIVHNMFYMIYENTQIEIKNGKIYNWRINEWVNTIFIGSLSSGLNKTFHVTCEDPLLVEGYLYEVKKDEKIVLDEIYSLPELMEEGDGGVDADEPTHIKVDTIDHTKYMFRQKTQELLYKSKNRNCKKELKKFFEYMKTYMKDNHIVNDLFWKVLLDDIFIVYKTIGTEYAHLYSNSRQISQGMQHTYAVNNIDELNKFIQNQKRRYRRNISLRENQLKSKNKIIDFGLDNEACIGEENDEGCDDDDDDEDDNEEEDMEHIMLDNTQTTYSSSELLDTMRSISNTKNEIIN